MSYETEVHRSQMAMLRLLLLRPSAGFAELQHAARLESDAANFHIKQLVQASFVQKTEPACYALTPVGKEYANRMDTDVNVIERQPKVSVALIIEHTDGRFLAQQRLKHPYFGYWGRPTGKVRWGEHFSIAAARELLEETGLTATLRIAGFYHKMDYQAEGGGLLEDKLFCVVHGTLPQGELLADVEGHHNEWLSNELLMAKDKVFSSVPEITAMVQANDANFLEKQYEYSSEQY